MLLVETDAAQNEAAQSVSGAADDPDPAEALDNRTVRLLAGEEILELSMEDYLTGVLLSEMPVDFHRRRARHRWLLPGRLRVGSSKAQSIRRQTCARTSPAVRRGQAGGIWNGNTAMILLRYGRARRSLCGRVRGRF